MIRRAPLAAGLVLTLGACDLALGLSYRTAGEHLECSDEGCQCETSWDSCDGDPDNGCETNLLDEASCGSCGARCLNGTCVGGFCLCKNDVDDCDGDLDNGCEASLRHDPKNCGSCGHDCLGGACVGGRCEPVVVYRGQRYIRDLAMMGDDFYILTKDEMMVVPKEGLVTRASKSLCRLMLESYALDDLAVTPSILYALVKKDIRTSSLVACPITGGTMSFPFASPHFIRSLATLDDYAYVIASEMPMSPSGWLIEVAPGASAFTTRDAPDLCAGCDLVANTGYVYWADHTRIHALDPLAGSTSLVYEASTGDLRRLYAANATRLFFQVGSVDAVYMLQLGSNRPSTLGAPFDYSTFAADESTFYLGRDADLQIIPLGVNRETRVVRTAVHSSIVWDERSIYWASDDRIMRLAK